MLLGVWRSLHQIKGFFYKRNASYRLSLTLLSTFRPFFLLLTSSFHNLFFSSSKCLSINFILFIFIVLSNFFYSWGGERRGAYWGMGRACPLGGGRILGAEGAAHRAEGVGVRGRGGGRDSIAILSFLQPFIICQTWDLL